MAGGGQPGNKNATKNRPFADAINRALAQDDGKRLRAIAEALLTKAADGDIPAIKEFAERVDGKVIQQIEQSTELSGNLFQRIEMVVVDPSS